MKTSRILFIVLALAVGGTGVYYVTRPPQPPPVEPAAEPPLPVEPAPVEAEPPVTDAPQPAAAHADSLSICSFNIQFLGNFKDKEDEALANILRDYDIIVIQELVAPPYEGVFPDGEEFKPDAEAAEFFDAMTALGFDHALSEEDTGTGDNIHVNSSATEWYVVFFRPNIVSMADDLPRGFLAADRSNHDDYERVPYAFALQTTNRKVDFVLISVHLKPGAGSADEARRSHELASIGAWIDANDDVEKDFIILGDMNIKDADELVTATPLGFISLNDECRPTNTKGDKPYDHVMFRPDFTGEIDLGFDMMVVDLVEVMRPYWTDTAPYPGDPYDHNEFRQHYSDHHPVIFRMNVPATDDD